MPRRKGGKELFSSVTADWVGCIDGRPGLFLLEKKNGRYAVTLDEEQLKQKNYPQVLGAALGFVAAAETQLGITKEAAFDLVEKALKAKKYKPAIHIDDKHGSLKNEYQNLYKKGNKERLAQEILERLEGCGFAVFQWKEKALEYIKEAINRGWVVLVLTGEHEESRGGAYVNMIPGTSLNVVGANEQGSPAFNRDYWFVQLILEEMERIAQRPGFAEKGQTFLNYKTYPSVVTALKGVQDPSQIKVRK